MGSETLVKPLSPQTVSALQSTGAWVLDVREFEGYGEAHLPNSLTIQLSHPKFVERAHRLIPQDTSLILVVHDESDVETAARRVSEAGHYTFAGYLAGGLAAWRAAGLPIATLEQMSIHELNRRMERQDPTLLVVDCRERIEWEGLDRIPRSALLPLFEVEQRCQELDTTRKIVLICERGHRSTTAASIMERRGLRNLCHVREGLVGWRAAHYPTVS